MKTLVMISLFILQMASAHALDEDMTGAWKGQVSGQPTGVFASQEWKSCDIEILSQHDEKLRVKLKLEGKDLQSEKILTLMETPHHGFSHGFYDYSFPEPAQLDPTSTDQEKKYTQNIYRLKFNQKKTNLKFRLMHVGFVYGRIETILRYENNLICKLKRSEADEISSAAPSPSQAGALGATQQNSLGAQ